MAPGGYASTEWYVLERPLVDTGNARCANRPSSCCPGVRRDLGGRQLAG